MFFVRNIFRATIVLALLFLSIIIVMDVTGRNMLPGRQIAYVSQRSSERWDIYLMDIGRKLAYNVTGPFMPHQSRSRLPAWSPVGDRLAFVSDEWRGGMSILLLQPERWQLRFMQRRTVDQTNPVWSPAGMGTQRIAYEVHNGHDWDIHIYQLDNYNVRLIQDAPTRPLIDDSFNDRNPQWSPDGTLLSFRSDRDASGFFDLYVVDAKGRSVRRLTTRMILLDYAPVWSPSGTHIAFVSQRDGNSEVYIVNVGNGAITNLTRHPGNDYGPQWSPDGTHIAFVSTRDGDDEIYVMDSFGDDVRQLTDNTVFDNQANWSPDSRFLTYVSTPGFGLSEIYLVEVENGHVQRLTSNIFTDWFPVWRP